MRSTVTDKALPFLGGILCLDFVNTVDPRHRPPREDFLPSFEKLVEWGHFVGLLTAPQRRAMLAEGVADAALAADVHRRAIDLREALFQLFRPSRRPGSEALFILNRELEHSSAALALERHAGAYRWTWRPTTASERVLGAVARSAADLLTSSARQYVRECAGDGCGWLFLDTSKAHRRRWCSMAICGNRAKAQRHRRTRRDTHASGESL